MRRQSQRRMHRRSTEHAQIEHGACADRARSMRRQSRRCRAGQHFSTSVGSRLPAHGATTSLSTTAAVSYLVRVSVFIPNSDKKRAEPREQDKASESK